jgi:serine kinase of HPr protein (carbohydrate metabolism regulator)
VIRHAGLIAQRLNGRWAGVLIEGVSGSGKSDLALRALDHGFRLVADDRVLVWRSDGRLYGRSPKAIHGLIEVRGVGVLQITPLAYSEIVLAVRLGAPERLPEPATKAILDVSLPCLTVPPFEESAPAKLGRALAAFDAAHKRRI